MQLINDLSVKLKRYEKDIGACINRVLQSGWLVLGPEVEKFEQSFADYHSMGHCIGVANGTDALELALRAIDIKQGSKVATAANAGAYTTSALNVIGASAYYLEVDQHTQCTTLESVSAALAAGVNAVAITHLFGRVVPEVDEIAALCAERGVPLLEDCAQAHGASLYDKLAGSFGDVASFSFYPTKNLGALGDGGAVLTNKREYADRVRQLRQYGWLGKYEIEIQGGRNSRLDAIQAALLNEFLPHLKEWNEERLHIALRYDAEIQHPQVSKPPITKECSDKPYVAHLYVVQSPSRDALKEHLAQHKIMSEVHYPLPDHLQKGISSQRMDVSLPTTETLARNILTLPCYSGMSENQVSHVIESVNSWTA